jgi:hypothetical protein
MLVPVRGRGYKERVYNSEYGRNIIYSCIGTCTLMFFAVLFTIAKLCKQPRCPSTDKWIKKMWYLFTVEFYSAVKKNEILSFASK